MIQQIKLTVNGVNHQLEIPATRLLIDCLRYDLGLTGTKEGCSVGVCGACTVLVDGRLSASCITLAVAADGAAITTIEGLAQGGNLHPVQQAFIDHGGYQCGICTPGQVVAAVALLEANPDPNEDDVREWMKGNLCRCTGYYAIMESVVNAARLAHQSGSHSSGAHSEDTGDR
ncbi:MAG: ferredoxin [SAR202 cluster bacterium Io17-Chloro-G7]|nr:MAG: ferredoxin [SAR202 cluster bacterium Io17-Chloro-G7]